MKNTCSNGVDSDYDDFDKMILMKNTCGRPAQLAGGFLTGIKSLTSDYTLIVMIMMMILMIMTVKLNCKTASKCMIIYPHVIEASSKHA